MERAEADRDRRESATFGADLLASVVVFLVALPLCMGIAIASGAPIAAGLITGIVGGIAVGLIAGSPLQVSGPAAGLSVLVYDFVREFGWEAVPAIVVCAGLLQLLCGLAGLGQWFRAVSPAVVQGMLAGIGVLIFASQVFVMMDAQPRSSGWKNLLGIPVALWYDLQTESMGSEHYRAGAIGLVCIATIVIWKKIQPKSLKYLPGPLLAVLVGTGLATISNRQADSSGHHDDQNVKLVQVPDNIQQAIRVPTWENLESVLFHVPHHDRKSATEPQTQATSGVANVTSLPATDAWIAPVRDAPGAEHTAKRGPFSWTGLLGILSLAFIASAETLLSATAVDRMHSGPRTRYDRELASQGVGNMVAGLLGGLPMTGVIVRSSANVQAGAKTRWSAVLHGVWLLLFVALLPGLLQWIPTCALAAILVYTGYKLVDVQAIRELAKYGWTEVAIYFATMIVIVATDLLTGVAVGLALSLVKLFARFSRLDIELSQDPQRRRTALRLSGAATFVRLPKLAAALEKVPPSTELHVEFADLDYIDHACLDLLINWEKQHETTGGRLVIDWGSLHARFRSRRSGNGQGGVEAAQA